MQNHEMIRQVQTNARACHEIASRIVDPAKLPKQFWQVPISDTDTRVFDRQYP